MPSFLRTLKFLFKSVDKSEKLEQLTYALYEESLMAGNNNPENAIYDIRIDGTTNLTTILGACAFATQGRFYGLSSNAFATSVPVIKNESGETVLSSETDSSYLTVEPESGLVLSSNQAWQTNLNVFNDNLLFINQNSDYGQFMPLVYIRKTVQLDSD